ncbi:MAG: hypothetical protein IH624_05240 [Phycisphaerae bacterium]|nr:hypothetical protein [Phycisphaerae bacterium]
MRHKTILLSLAIAVAALLSSCQEQSAFEHKTDSPADCTIDDYDQFADCDSWQKWLNLNTADDYAARTDLSLPGRYPWCEALDGYYQANALWQYGDNHWAQAFCAGDIYEDLIHRHHYTAANRPEPECRTNAWAHETAQMYYLDNPEQWRAASIRSAGAIEEYSRLHAGPNRDK